MTSTVLSNAVIDGIVRFAEGRGARVSLNENLGRRTTYRVGGAARVLIDVTDPATVGGIGDVVPDDVPVIIIGNGSNILVSDEGFDGIVVAVSGSASSKVSSREISFVPVVGTEECDVDARAHVRLPVLARQTVAAGWCGLEWAVGVPGSVGGAVRMNAGGHGSDMAASLVHVDLVNLRSNVRRTVTRGELGLRFRGSALSDDHAVVSARLRVNARGSHSCDAELAEIVAWRRDHQPGGQNAGSVFVNPGEGSQSAGALIDSCGLRGLRAGTAEVSTKHANFIQADVDGKADDVVALMTTVQARVREHTGVSMRSEVRLLGFPRDVERLFIDPQREEPSVVSAERTLRSLV